MNLSIAAILIYYCTIKSTCNAMDKVAKKSAGEVKGGGPGKEEGVAERGADCCMLGWSGASPSLLCRYLSLCAVCRSAFVPHLPSILHGSMLPFPTLVRCCEIESVPLLEIII